MRLGSDHTRPISETKGPVNQLWKPLVVAKCLADVALQPRSAGQFSHVRENSRQSELTLVLHLFAYCSLKLETTNHQPLVHLAPQHGDVGESGLGQLLAAGHAPLQPRFF